MGNVFGRRFRIMTFGESHGKGVGVVIEGLPGNMPVDATLIEKELKRRRPGQSPYVSPRQEPDSCEIVSGIYQNRTLGTPIALIVYNRDARSEDYETFQNLLRPSHADYTYYHKYQIYDYRGGGRASARETIGRVAAGALAKQFLSYFHNVEIVAWVEQIHSIRIPSDLPPNWSSDEIEANPVRCPHPETADAMMKLIRQMQEEGDSVGGIIRCQARNVPIGWGEPVFDKVEALLAHAMLSLPASRGILFGDAEKVSEWKGSQFNDLWTTDEKGMIRTQTNHGGGTLGGITNGEIIDFKVLFKPPSTIRKPQPTITWRGEPTLYEGKGRHDPCVLPRAVPIVEAMTAITLTDLALLQASNRYYASKQS